MLAEALTDKQYVDLHIHTFFSDGTSSPEEVVGIACEKNLVAIAITDHDCIDGIGRAQRSGAQLGIEVVPGVEFSSQIDGVDIHILGYFIDTGNTGFTNRLQQIKKARYVRAQKIVRNLNHQGVDLRFETVLNIAGEGVLGRPHIAAAMLKEELVYSFKEAFDKYIGYDSPAYVEKFRMHPREVFALIHGAGGIAVLAHPGVTGVDERIPEFVADGLGGIEVFHSEHGASDERRYKRICRKNNLVMTGGSDYHSKDQNKTEIGSPQVSATALEALKKRRGSSRDGRSPEGRPPAARVQPLCRGISTGTTP